MAHNCQKITCVICYAEDTQENVRKTIEEFSELLPHVPGEPVLSITIDATIIFTLRHVLKIPVDEIGKLLERSKSPIKWEFFVCVECAPAVKAALRNHIKIKELAREMEIIQSQVEKRVKTSYFRPNKPELPINILRKYVIERQVPIVTIDEEASEDEDSFGEAPVIVMDENGGLLGNDEVTAGRENPTVIAIEVDVDEETKQILVEPALVTNINASGSTNAPAHKRLVSIDWASKTIRDVDSETGESVGPPIEIIATKTMAASSSGGYAVTGGDGLTIKHFNPLPIAQDEIDEAESADETQEPEEIAPTPKQRRIRKQPQKKSVAVPGEVFQCDRCVKKFQTYAGLVTHVNLIHSGEKTCGYCDLTLDNHVNLMAHVKNEHRNEICKVMCELCSKIFVTEYQLAFHQNRQHKTPMPNKFKSSLKVCDECGKKFPNGKTLNAHRRRLHGPVGERIHCRFQGCAYAGKDKHAVKKHVKFVHEKVPRPAYPVMVCPECGKMCRRKEILDRHRKFVHGVEDVDVKLYKLKCTYDNCDMNFKGKTRLAIHLNAKHGENVLINGEKPISKNPRKRTSRDRKRRKSNRKSTSAGGSKISKKRQKMMEEEEEESSESETSDECDDSSDEN